MFDFDALPDDAQGAGDDGGEAVGLRVYAVSDVHTDKRENMEVLRAWPRRPEDVLILAGDVSHDLAVLRATFQVALERFGYVFYCPGNHDLWLHAGDGCKDSVEKLRRIEALCEELGVRTRPGSVGGVYIVPLHSWYHAGFDADPDVEDKTLAPIEHVMMDFHLCKWPRGLSPHDGSTSIADFMDGLNDEGARQWPPSPRGGPVISFSHFLPRQDLLPEKRTLFYPHLAKAVGSLPLGERVRRLAPDLHVFGHTHYGWAAQLDGVRFVQACLGYPLERVERPFSVLCSDALSQEALPPLFVYDHARREYPEYQGFWSEYYRVHPRKPEDVTWIYRGKRKKAAVLEALRHVVNSGTRLVDDASIRMWLHT